MPIPDKATRDEWRRLAKETTMVSGLGEYTPDEFTVLLDAIDQLTADPTPEVIEACAATACDHTASSKGVDDMTFAEMDDAFKKQWTSFTAIAINAYRKAINATA
jgi:hypothetical protein